MLITVMGAVIFVLLIACATSRTCCCRAIDVSDARGRGAIHARRDPLAHHPPAADRERRAVEHRRPARTRPRVVRRACVRCRRFKLPARPTGSASRWITACCSMWRRSASRPASCSGSRRRWHMSRANQHDTLKEGARGSFGNAPRRPLRAGPHRRRAGADGGAAVRRGSDVAQLHRPLRDRPGIRRRRPVADADAVAAVELSDR